MEDTLNDLYNLRTIINEQIDATDEDNCWELYDELDEVQDKIDNLL